MEEPMSTPGRPRSVRLPRLVVALSLPAALLAACGDVTQRSQPSWFTDRQPLPACEDVVLEPGQSVPEGAADCLFAGADSGAELRVRSPTTEGDPIYTYYRRLPGEAGLDLMSDATRDRYGGDGWQWVTCPDATSPSDIGECTTQAVGSR